jgi:hypothetical protein
VITNARIIGANTNAAAHHQQEVKRGDKAFVMSASEIKRLRQSPFSWRYGEPTEESAAMIWGGLIDALVMPCGAAGCYVETPETYGPDNKPWNWNANACKAWREALPPGVVAVKPEWMESARQAVAALKAYEPTYAIIEQSDHQVLWMATWRDSATGIEIPLAGVIDMVPRGCHEDALSDLKTTSKIGEKAWAKQVFNLGHHIQAALYLDAWNAARPDDKRDVFLQVVQANDAPYEPANRELDDEWIVMGRREYTALLKDYARCLASGYWPRLDEMESTNRSPRGWNVCRPEAWMVMQGPQVYSNIEDI